jgi:hypothetical protein
MVKAKQKVLPDNKDVTTFRGLDRLPSIEKGELRSMLNLCSDNPTCLSPRKPRQPYRTLSSGTALFAANNGKLCWVDGTNFYYDGTVKGTVTVGAKCMCDFGTYILIFPDKKYYNYTLDTFGTLGNGTTYGVTYDSEGNKVPLSAGSVPDMDMICTFNNRVWGVKDKYIYASKYNDPTNWTQFSVPLQETDSIYFEINSENGVFKAIKALENYLVAITTKSFYEIFGNKPSNYTPKLLTNSCGCVDGKSLAEIDGNIYFLENDGVNRYGGSFPQPVSIQLQEKNCVSGIGVSLNRKYYINIYNGTTYSLYVYDALLQQWHMEDNLHVIDFAVVNNKIYALASDNVIYMFNYPSGTTVSWQAELDRFTLQYLGQKATNKIKIEVELETGSSMSVYIRTDGSEYRLLNTDTTTGYHYFPVFELPRSAFWAQLKLTGTGNCKVYSVTREIIVNSDIE